MATGNNFWQFLLSVHLSCFVCSIIFTARISGFCIGFIVCLSRTAIRVIPFSTQVDTMFWGVLDHLVDVCGPCVYLSQQIYFQGFTWQLRSHL